MRQFRADPARASPPPLPFPSYNLIVAQSMLLRKQCKGGMNTPFSRCLRFHPVTHTAALRRLSCGQKDAHRSPLSQAPLRKLRIASLAAPRDRARINVKDLQDRLCSYLFLGDATSTVASLPAWRRKCLNPSPIQRDNHPQSGFARRQSELSRSPRPFRYGFHRNRTRQPA